VLLEGLVQLKNIMTYPTIEPATLGSILPLPHAPVTNYISVEVTRYFRAQAEVPSRFFRFDPEDADDMFL
jgi:hypothetical protein